MPLLTGVTDMYHSFPALFVEIRVFLTFSLGCPETTVLLISISQVVRTIGFSQHAWP
jgi:hypothetical protein